MSNSISQWIVDLQKGDAVAAQRLWERYFSDLVNFARGRINKSARRITDEEDVALSVFDSLCRGAQAGRFSELKGRDELWMLLLAITRRKIVDQHRLYERTQKGPGLIKPESDISRKSDSTEFFEIDGIRDEDPSPDLMVQMDEEWQRLLALLRDSTLRRIASWRLEGYSVDEIARKLGVLPRTVNRKLVLIRSRWWKEISQ
ncbi:MAG: RNA polymerase subunit sigma-70 [Planctomycetes bacterium]|nr:RNA polymerase subunit sigma-70 [Planctomycetota bacterium]